MKEIKLRPYQESAISELRLKYAQGKRRVLLVVPCGGGKTTIAGFLIKSYAKKKLNTLFLAHRTELIFQCWKRLTQIGLYANIIKASISKWKIIEFAESHGIEINYHEILDNVITASIQTISRRLVEYVDNNFDLIIIDEAHTSISDSYVQFISKFQNAFVIGLTATPYRTSKKEGLNKVYEDFVEVVSHQELIDMNYLVPTRVFHPKKFNSSSLKVQKGEFTDESVLRAFDENNAEINLISQINIHSKHLKTIVFCQNVEHSKRTADVLNVHGFKALHIDATTEQNDRDEVVRKFRKGDIQFLVNYGLLSEGFDVPDCECVILNLCTKSRIKWHQATNRATRVLTHVGNEYDDSIRAELQQASKKQFAVIIDMADNTERFGFVEMPFEVSLEAKSTFNGEAPTKECKGYILMPHVVGDTIHDDKLKCNAVLHTTVMICPTCGYRFPEKENKHVVQETEFVEAKRKTYISDEVKPYMHLKSHEWYKIPDNMLKAFGEAKGYHHRWASLQLSLRQRKRKKINVIGNATELQIKQIKQSYIYETLSYSNVKMIEETNEQVTFQIL